MGRVAISQCPLQGRRHATTLLNSGPQCPARLPGPCRHHHTTTQGLGLGCSAALPTPFAQAFGSPGPWLGRRSTPPAGGPCSPQVLPQLGGICGEPLFIPAPGAVEEDEGVVLATLVQPDGRAALVCVDGQSFEERARAVLPYGLPIGFHATWDGA